MSGFVKELIKTSLKPPFSPKGIQTKYRFRQLRIDLESGARMFPTLLDALPTLEELGVVVQVSGKEKMDRELSRETWSRRDNGSDAEMLDYLMQI